MSRDDCDCCPPGGDTAELPPSNPAGLAAISYRVGTQPSFKRAMKERLGAQAALARLSTRTDDDPALALIDAWACSLDVLTFYQERIANEGFLGTCTERRSVLELARAIGYELRPGVAASTALAFTLETIGGAPPAATIPAGTRVQSVPAQGQQAQTFETLEAIDARAAWNALSLPASASVLPLARGRRVLYLAGQNTRLQPGDALLVVGDERLQDTGNENWDFRRVLTVRVVQPSPPTPDGSGSYTVVTLDRGLGRTEGFRRVNPAHGNARVYALRTRAALFGNNAPDWRAMPVQMRATYLGLPPSAADAQGQEIVNYPQWPGFSLAELSDPPPAGTALKPGLLAVCYDGIGFNRLLGSRVDEQLDFGAGAASAWPDGVPATNFSTRWAGWLKPQATGPHDFQTCSDDGVRLWIDGKLLIDNWTSHAPTFDPPTGSATPARLTLTAGARYELRLEFFQGGGPSTLQLRWQPPGANAFATIPKTVLDARAVYDLKLDATYPRMAAGSWVVLASSAYTELYTIAETGETACADFAMSAKSTWLRLTGENLFERFNFSLRETAVFGDPEELAWADPPRSGLVGGTALTLATDGTGLSAGRRVAISGLAPAPSADAAILARLKAGEALALLRVTDDGRSAALRFEADVDAKADLLLPLVPTTEMAELQGVDESGATTVLRFMRELANSWLPQTVRINANVAPASHGDSRQMRLQNIGSAGQGDGSQLLAQPEAQGSGDGSATFQSFTLKQAPLTYVSAANASGAETTLQLSVSGVAWQEVSSLYGTSADARIFTTRRADDGTVTLRFGDGLTGARLPTGVENVQAVYRVGIGAPGNLDAGQLNLLLTPQLGLKSVTNPVPATGGTDPEPFDRARRNAPLTVLTLERIVSLVDFEDFAAAFTGIGKARAVWLWDGQQRLVHLSVAAIDGAELPIDSALFTNLRAAIDAARPPHQELRIAVGEVVSLPLEARIAVTAGYAFDAVSKAVAAALTDRFGFDARDFTQPLSGSEVVATMQAVAGVDHVALISVGSGGRVTNLQSDPIEARGARWDGTLIAPAELLLLDSDGIKLTALV